MLHADYSNMLAEVDGNENKVIPHIWLGDAWRANDRAAEPAVPH